jgi:hypothetical protein
MIRRDASLSFSGRRLLETEHGVLTAGVLVMAESLLRLLSLLLWSRKMRRLSLMRSLMLTRSKSLIKDVSSIGTRNKKNNKNFFVELA